MVICRSMLTPLLKAPMIALTSVALSAGALVDGYANEKKPRTGVPTEWSVERDAGGTPIIMREEEPPKRPRPAPRGSGGYYVPPPVPSPNAGPPAPALLQPPPAPYKPPPIRSFGDRVVDCIHSYPLNAGIGNNPIDHQTYIRQCAN
jgi:hypothetical protein